MVDVSIVDVISIGAGGISIILAIVAMWFSKSAEKESRENYEKTKDVLSNIEEKSAVIETTVNKAQDQLLSTVTKIVEETAIPKQVKPDEQMGMALLQMMSNNPADFTDLMKTMGPFMQQNQGQQKPKNK